MAGRQGFARRTAEAVKDAARDRATIARRRAVAKLRGHKRHCPDCGRPARTAEQVTACREKHKRERTKGKTGPSRSKTGPSRGNPIGSGWGKPKSRKFVGREQYTDGNGKRHRNLLDWKDAERRRVEKEDDAKRRAAERGRRTAAVNGRTARGGKPKGTPKTRPARDGKTSAERKAEWKAQRVQMAAGRMKRDGTRIPHEPSPRTVRPKTRPAPKAS